MDTNSKLKPPDGDEPTEPPPIKKVSKRPMRKPIPKQPLKRAKASFEKKPVASLTLTPPLFPNFELATSFLHVPATADVYFDMIRSKDQKILNDFTSKEFQYIVLLCVYYRCATITCEMKIRQIQDRNLLGESVNTIQLPNIVAQFVETFGSVPYLGQRVIPYFRNYQRMITKVGFLDPRILLRQILNGDYDSRDVESDWAVYHPIIEKYQKAIARALKTPLAVRTPNYGSVEGRAEFLSVYEPESQGKVSCYSIAPAEIYSCQLGCAYRFRTHDMLRMHGTFVPGLFQAAAVRPESVLRSHFNHSGQ